LAAAHRAPSIDAIEVRRDQRVNDDVERIGPPLDGLEGRSDILRPPDLERKHFDAEGAGRRLDLAHLRGGGGIVRFDHDCQPANLACKLAQQLNSLARDIGGLVGQARYVSTRSRQ